MIAIFLQLNIATIAAVHTDSLDETVRTTINLTENLCLRIEPELPLEQLGDKYITRALIFVYDEIYEVGCFERQGFAVLGWIWQGEILGVRGVIGRHDYGKTSLRRSCVDWRASRVYSTKVPGIVQFRGDRFCEGF